MIKLSGRAVWLRWRRSVILDSHELKRRLVLRLKSMESGRLLIGPETVHFRLTDLCNLTCHYCWEYGPNNPDRPTGKNHLPFEVFQNVVRDCAQLRVDKVELSGIGDPTLHPRFYDMLQCFEQSFKVVLFTNGTFPIERCQDILRVDHILINLGAADRESYRVLQGNDLFMRVVKNIRELARLRPQFNPDFRLDVVFVETSINAKSFSKTQNLVKKLGADVVHRTVFESSDHNRHLMLVDQKKNEVLPGQWLACYHGWFESAIRFNGDVNVCPFSKQLTIGNVFRKSFKDIWESDEYSSARSLALKGKKPFGNSHACINCRAVSRNQEIGAQVDMFNRSWKK